MIFKKNGFMCNVSRDTYEHLESLINRGYFVANQKPTNNQLYEEAVLYSRIYMNIKYKKCEYNNQVLQKLQTFN